MSWQGKALGALIGVVAAGPVGAAFGAFIGHLFDAQASSSGAGRASASAARVEEIFFRAVFQVMGRLAKADGRVSEQEIRAARAVMHELRLGERETLLAMELFTQGKSPGFALDDTLRVLAHACAGRADLRRMFVQIQLQAALWGESLNPAGRELLSRICAALEISAYELVQMEALLRMQQWTRGRRPEAERRGPDRVAQAYEVLGVAPAASDAEVTRAYRRLMNRNHPDKLHAKGLPESMMQLAAEKTRQIREAYELLREARRMR